MKRTALRRIGKSPTSRLMKECNDLWSRWVRSRDGWRCRACNDTFVVQGAHILPKGRYRSMRYQFDNGIALCRRCHMRQHHMTYEDQQAFFESIVGKEHIERLKLRAKLIRKTNLAATRIYLVQAVTRAGC